MTRSRLESSISSQRLLRADGIYSTLLIKHRHNEAVSPRFNISHTNYATMKSIVLLSSGLDSTVAFKEAFDRCDEVLCVTFNYGQRAGKKEIEFAKAICKQFR